MPSMSLRADGDGVWDVFWASQAWSMLADKLEETLPTWAVLRRIDPTKQLVDQVAEADVIVPTNAEISPKILAAATHVRLVVNPAAGYNNIAHRECARRGIPLCTMPGINAVSVAEGALCCILMLARRANEQQEEFRQRTIGLPLGTLLHGKTLGIIGLGAVGQRLAPIATAMGMKVLGTTSGSSRQDLERVLRDSDVVSLHCPLNDRTRGLISRKELALMKDGALLVNYARGAVLDEQAVTEAVFAGKLGGLGLDVFWEEPEDPTKPLYQHPMVVCFPHSGTSTEEAMQACANFIVDNIVRLREGKPLLSQLQAA